MLALNSRSPESAASGLWTGHSLTVETVKGGIQQFDASMIRQTAATWPLAALSPWFFLLGTLIYARARQPLVGRAAYVLFVSAAFALGLAPGSIDDRPVALAVAAEWVAHTLFDACFLLFFLVFPVSRGSVRQRTLVLAPAIFVAAISPLATVLPALHYPTSQLRMLVLLIYPLAGIGLLLYSLVRLKEPDTRRGVTIIAIGTAVSILPFMGLAIVPIVLGRPEILAAEYAILPLALMPASFAYAILRHDVLRVPLLQRWLVRSIAWVVVILPYTSPP